MSENNNNYSITSQFQDAYYIIHYESKINHDLLMNFLSSEFSLFKQDTKHHIEDIYAESLETEEESTIVYKHISRDLYISYQSYKKSKDKIPFVWNLTIYAYLDKGPEKLYSKHIPIETLINEIKNKILDMLSPLSEDEKGELIQEQDSNLLTLDINADGAIELLPIDLEGDVEYSFIESLYNKKTRDSIYESIEHIKSSLYDCYVLYGEEGTGKSSSIDIIANEVKDKKFVHIPIRLLESSLSSGEFLEYLRSNNVVLVLDDIERLEHLYNSKTPSILTSIVELVNGLTSRVYNVELILIYNTTKKLLKDDSFSKIGINLFKSVYFNRLLPSEVRELFENVEIKVEVNDERQYLLSEVFNPDNRIKTIKKFGF